MVALRRLLLVNVCTLAELPQIDLLGPSRSALILMDWTRRSATSQPSSRSIGSRIPGHRCPSLSRGRPPDRGRPLDRVQLLADRPLPQVAICGVCC
jgi:hypothetical protein